MASMMNTTKHLRKKLKLMITFYNLFLKTEAEGAVTNALYESIIILIPKLDKDKTKREHYRTNISHGRRYKNPQQLGNQI